MTKLLQEALKKVKALPEKEEDRIAAQLLHELEDDAKWEATTRKHADKLAKLVEQVLEEERRGETEELDPDRL